MIKQYIKKQGITKSQFARRANISRQLLNWHLQNPKSPWKYQNAVSVVVAIYGEAIREKVVDLVLGK